METNWITIISAFGVGILLVGYLIRANYKDEKTFETELEKNSEAVGLIYLKPDDTTINEHNSARSRAQLKNLILYILFAFSSGLIVINRLTTVYITHYQVHFLLIFIAAATFIISIGHLFGKLKSNRSIKITFLLVLILCGIKAFFTWGGDWKTQTVLYRNLTDSGVTIETQMRDDPLSFTYKSRVVQVSPIVPFMVVTKDVDTTRLDSVRWKRVNEYRNELQLTQSK